MNPEKPFDPKEPTNSDEELESSFYERPNPSRMFDSVDRRFYESHEFQVVANEVWFSQALRQSSMVLRNSGVTPLHVGPEDLANEAMRRTFKVFPNNISKIEDTSDARRQYFKNLLSLIARRLACSLRRTISSREQVLKTTPIDDRWDIADPANACDTWQCGENSNPQLPTDKLEAVIATLSERDQDVLRLCSSGELSQKEIAKALGTTEGAVKTRNFRAKQKLRELLRNEPDFKQLFEHGGSNGK